MTKYVLPLDTIHSAESDYAVVDVCPSVRHDPAQFTVEFISLPDSSSTPVFSELRTKPYF